MTLEGEDIICVAGAQWDGRWLSLHQYMRRLARANRVLWVDRPVSVVSVPWLPPSRRPAPSERGTVRHVVDGLYVATPPAAPPLRFERPLTDLHQLRRSAFIRRAARRLGLSETIVWAHDFDSAGTVARLGGMTVAFVTDDWAVSPVFGSNRANRVSAMRARERRLLTGADLVLTTSASLRDAKGALNPNTHCVPHGVDAALLAAATLPETPSASAVAALARPVIGLVGNINDRVDADLLTTVAWARPEWSFALVGPVGESMRERLAGPVNVHLLGPAPREELPRWLKPMDVCVIPYVIDAYTRHSHPLKALEYLAAGKPVVATDLPGLAPYGAHVLRAAGAEGFIAAVESALAEDSPDRAAQRTRYAAENDWESRLETVCQLIEATRHG